MNVLAEMFTSIVVSSTVEETACQSLATIIKFYQPKRASLVLWDDEMGRYIMGDMLSVIEDTSPADARRDLLQMANLAYAENHTTPRYLIEGVFYDPLNTNDNHIGAFLFVNSQTSPDPTNQDYKLLHQIIAHTLMTVNKVEKADQIQRQLQEDRQRLAHLLEAVNQQQRTIDDLLALEREFSSQLEDKVRERTAELQETQRRLIQSEKLAVIGKLASSLMHEINNPLQAIQSGLGLVLDELNLPAKSLIGQDLATIQSELERIQVIFRQLLDLNRPITQHDYAPIDLNLICDETYVLLRKRLQEIGVEILFDLATNLPLICGDRNQIKQVLLNLLLNAAEAMPNSNGRIVVSTYASQKSVHLSVMDNGCGIATDYLNYLFEPLFTTKARGLGLGLSISLEIVHQHQGTIAVESTPNTGTTFIVSLPTRSDCDDPTTDRR